MVEWHDYVAMRWHKREGIYHWKAWQKKDVRIKNPKLEIKEKQEASKNKEKLASGRKDEQTWKVEK